ncbi:dihydropteroate synthase [Capillimicrobium parvum]|uniref:dihydropteroate synthase n=1 Tax=Capillimicrobium parvum TaxID=2884022 RepID=UPI00216B52D8|nr:dihydropteroate synthase [Capillimicrobium parvum]
MTSEISVTTTAGPLAIGTTPLLMGVVNATPNSFSDAGQLRTLAQRVARAETLLDAGADLIDVGGQSGVTNEPEIPVAEEIGRVLPLVRALAAERDVLVSVDTYRPEVARAVLDAGAAIVNDTSGLLYPDVAVACAEAGAGLVVMHNRGRPKQRLTDPALYDDVVEDVVSFLRERIAVAGEHGLSPEHVIVDPGPDFAKTPAQTVQVLRRLDRVEALGRPVLLALSRKDFLGVITGRRPRERLAATLAAVAAVTGRPGHILRVHDVAEVRDLLRVLAVLRGDAEIADDAELAEHLRREPPAPAP